MVAMRFSLRNLLIVITLLFLLLPIVQAGEAYLGRLRATARRDARIERIWERAMRTPAARWSPEYEAVRFEMLRHRNEAADAATEQKFSAQS